MRILHNFCCFGSRGGIFIIGDLGYVGGVFFLLSSYCGAMESLDDAGQQKFKKRRIFAFLAPVSMILYDLIFFYIFEIKYINFVFVALSLVSIGVCYFALKHLIIPDIDLRILKVMRPYNFLILVMCFMQNCFNIPKLANLQSSLHFKIIICILTVTIVPFAHKGVKKMVYIILISIIFPLLMLSFLLDKNAKFTLPFTVLGMSAAALCYEINGAIKYFCSFNDFEFQIMIAPITEEIIKSIPPLFYVITLSDKKQNVIEIFIVVGIAFAILENFYLSVSNYRYVTMLWTIGREFAARLTHVVTTACIGYGTILVNKKAFLYRYFQTFVYSGNLSQYI